MAARLIAGLVSFLTSVAVGATSFFVLLMALNGYRESEASFGIAAFLLLWAAATIAVTVASILLVGSLSKRKFSRGVAASLSFTIVAAIILIFNSLCVLIGTAVAELVRAGK